MEYGILMIAFFLFAVVLGILWLILPFAVFGIKKRLDKMIEQNARLLERRA